MNATRIRRFHRLCLLIQRHAQNEIFGASNNWFRSVSAAVFVVAAVAVLFAFYPKKGALSFELQLRQCRAAPFSLQFEFEVNGCDIQRGRHSIHRDLAACLGRLEFCAKLSQQYQICVFRSEVH